MKEVIKKIKGREYKYLQWRENGKVKVKYIGPVNRKFCKTRLSEEIKKGLIEAYDKAGYSCQRVKEYARDVYGVNVSVDTIWRIMVEAGVIRKKGKSELKKRIEKLEREVKELKEELKREKIARESLEDVLKKLFGE